jgi:hypothetical protein
MKLYKCQDEDCKKIIPEDKRLKHSFRKSDGSLHYVFKCPYCRGSLEEIELQIVMIGNA